MDRMSEQQDDLGLRARKQRDTRNRIAEAGFALFLDRGFEAATLDAIADAAGISRRTLFNYFATKDDILLAWEAELEEALRTAVAARPDGETPFETVSCALLSLTEAFETDRAVAIDRLMHGTESLRARKQGSWQRKEEVLTAALAERWPDQALAGRLRLAAVIGIAALRVASDAWRADGGIRPIRLYLDEALKRLRDDLR